jgi:hypothetical protein
MARKIIPVLCMLVLVGVYACSDSDSVKPKQDEPLVAPPPRTINVNARLQHTLTSQTANVLVRVNSGSWTLVNSVPSTTCTNIGSFSASDGDTIQVMVLEATNPNYWTGEFRATTLNKCPSTGTNYCGDETFYTVCQFTLTSTINVVSLDVTVVQFNGDWQLLIC